MKTTTILLGLSLAANINHGASVYQNSTWELSADNFDSKSGLTSGAIAVSANVEACQQMYAAAMSACSVMAWNPPVFIVCAGAASAAFAACLAAG